MKLYPLVFSFRDLIAGNGFVAGVAMDGRVVLSEEEDGDTWMYGVQPGGIAGGDLHRDAAFSEFKKSYLAVLYDFAAEASSFQDFERKVTSFFNDVNASVLQDWTAALARVRAQNTSVDDLKTVKAEARTPRVVIVDVTKEMRPDVNGFDEISEAA